MAHDVCCGAVELWTNVLGAALSLDDDGAGRNRSAVGGVGRNIDRTQLFERTTAATTASTGRSAIVAATTRTTRTAATGTRTAATGTATGTRTAATAARAGEAGSATAATAAAIRRNDAPRARWWRDWFAGRAARRSGRRWDWLARNRPRDARRVRSTRRVVGLWLVSWFRFGRRSRWRCWRLCFGRRSGSGSWCGRRTRWTTRAARRNHSLWWRRRRCCWLGRLGGWCRCGLGSWRLGGWRRGGGWRCGGRRCWTAWCRRSSWSCRPGWACARCCTRRGRLAAWRRFLGGNHGLGSFCGLIFGLILDNRLTTEPFAVGLAAGAVGVRFLHRGRSALDTDAKGLA